MKAKLVKYTFFLVLIADIAVRVLGFDEFDKFLKPLLMPLMLYYLIERAEGKIYRNHLILALGLIVAWIGDILLLNKEPHYLMAGIGVFLITQLLYLIVFRSNIKGSVKQSIIQNKIVVGILLCFLTGMLALTTFFVEMPMMIFIGIYAITVASSTITSYLQNKMQSGYRLTTLGMSCFLLSDTLIGVNIFAIPIPLAPLFIMGTYGLAQYLITEGMVINGQSNN